MIRSIRIKNFESHVDTFIEFGNGFNLIRGDSDSGKTSIVRAMAVVCFNRWEPSMLRTGTDTCEIELVSERGSVMVVKGTKNSYYTSELQVDGSSVKNEFHSVNRTVPDVVAKITGMSVLEMGGITDLPNFMFQLDQHYMLSQVNGVSCTDNMVARIVDNVIGLGGMEDLITEISSDGSSKKREYNQNSGTITELKGKLHDPSMVADLRNTVDSAKERIKSIEEDYKLEKALADYFARYHKLVTNIDNMKASLSAKGDVAGMLLKLLAIDGLIKQYNELSTVQATYKTLNTTFNRCSMALKKMPDLLLVKKQIGDISILMDRMKALDAAKALYDDVSYRLNRDSNLKLEAIDKEKVAQEDKRKFEEETPMCPLCGKSFKEAA